MTDAGAYAFDFLDVRAMREHGDAFNGITLDVYRAVLEKRLADTGVPLDAVESMTSPAAGSVVQGSFEGAAVTDSLADADYASAGEEHGFEIYRSHEDDRVYGVRGSTLLAASRGLVGTGDPMAVVTRLAAVDARDRARDRAEDDDFGVLFDALDAGYFLTGAVRGSEATLLDGQVGVGVGCSLTDDPAESSVRQVFLFEDDGSVDREAVTDVAGTFEAGLDYGRGITELSVTGSGRAAVVEATVRTNDLIL